ncbi:hypothetical protein BCR42DRAFT_427383 [Absidia repens]|uniref:PH domain-containing protein n=1 Tax=Absidia repens TaxID=90262 RepID=A0A1X2HZT8_9FUNG|nr:hypothetical protein BCR42DRAFT_427383 [Absidia repens]
MLQLQHRNQRREKRATIDTESDHDDSREWLVNLRNKDHLIRYGHEILDQSRSKIELQDDGTLIITPHFRQYPTEIISLIVHYVVSDHQQSLYQYTLVNRQFYTEINPLLWKSPKIHTDSALDLFSCALMDMQSHMGHHIRALHVTGEYWTDIYFSLVMPHLRRLEEITIDDTTSITDACLRHLPRHCRHLTSLRLLQRPISPIVCKALGQHCHQLDHLELELGSDISPTILEALEGGCPLKRISLNFAGQADAVSEEIIADLSRFRFLTHLEFNKVAPTATKQLFYLIKRLTATTTMGATMPATAQVPTWPHLTSLSLIKCRLIEDSDLIPFLQSHPGLTEIRLGGGGQYTDESLYVMSVCLPQLTKVSLAYNQRITAEGVRRLIRNCHYLTSFTSRSCNQLSPADFPEAPDQWDEPQRVCKLHKKHMDRIRLAQW